MATPLPPNAASFSLAELLAATGGRLLQGSAESVTHVSTNSREIGPGALFVALQGKAHDAHEYVAAAAAAGALVAVVEREVEAPPDLTLVRVDSTLKALGDLAHAHVKRWRAPGRVLIAITGSAGKTTTRVAMSALLEELFPGEYVATTGNLNNRIGVPMVLFSLGEAHRVAVLELGTSEHGEIAELCRIVRPDVGILTLIAPAHLEGLGSIDGVAEEKGALFASLLSHGIAVGNAGDVRVRAALEASGALQVSYGRHEGASVQLVGRVPLGVTESQVVLDRREGRGSVFRTPLTGEAGALACAAALAAVEAAFDLSLDGPLLTRAFSRPIFGHQTQRLIPHRFANGIVALDDTYNANPSSMAASIEAAAEMATAMSRRLVLVLGEMGELGEESRARHEQLGRVAAASGAGLVLSVGGGEAWRVAEQAERAGTPAQHLTSVEEAARAVESSAGAQDLLLVKASRFVGADRIVERLAERYGV